MSEPKDHIRRKNLSLKTIFRLYNWQRKLVLDYLAVNFFFQFGAQKTCEDSALAKYLLVHVNVVQINIDDGLKRNNRGVVLIIKKWFGLDFTSLARKRSIRLFNEIKRVKN